MTREFIFTKPFLNCWKAMGLNNDHLKILERILLDNPQIGEVIQGTGGARKMRIQLDGRGKSGGGRVIYLDVFEKEPLPSYHKLWSLENAIITPHISGFFHP